MAQAHLAMGVLAVGWGHAADVTMAGYVQILLLSSQAGG